MVGEAGKFYKNTNFILDEFDCHFQYYDSLPLPCEVAACIAILVSV